MHVLKAQYFSNLPVTQRCLIVTHLACNRHAWAFLGKKVLRLDVWQGYGVISAIKDLKAKP
jgi:hypothetical protein